MKTFQKITFQKIRRRKTDDAEEKGGCKLLTDREKWLVHFCNIFTMSSMAEMPDRHHMVLHMMEMIRRERCRSLTDENIDKLLEEINEEMLGGKNMLKYFMGNNEQCLGVEDEM